MDTSTLRAITQLILTFACLAVLAAGCSEGPEATTAPVGQPDATAAGDADAASATDADATPPPNDPNLRPNVQEGQPPNATGQTPAFEDQTRAPQPSTATAFAVQEIAGGLQRPWGIAILPDGSMLITLRPGPVVWVDTDGTVSAPLDGVPEASAAGQGGMLDVALSPDFAVNRHVFLSYAEARDGGRGTTIARGTLGAGNDRLDDVTILYRQAPAWSGGRHFGSRVVFSPDGTLFATFGDRGDAFTDAQDPTNAIGAVIRINADGSIPADNPFASGGAGAPEIWSWGHRNIQSATIGADGALWTVEHGPAGGDELNRPAPGVNHGWPIISYGEDYNGQPVGDGITEQGELAQPVYYWDPVIAPCGMATYEGDLFEGFQGDLLVGGLRANAVVRLSLWGGRVYTEEWLNVGSRVRDVAVDANGAIIVITDSEDGRLLRLVPN